MPRAISLLFVSCAFLLNPAAAAQAPMQFGDPKDLSIADSIPANAGEKVVLFNKWLQVHWVIALVNLPYEQTRKGMREPLQDSVGIDSESEIAARIDLGKPFDTRPKESLFGDGATDFHSIGLRVTEGREFRIQTKRYNESWWNNYSKST